MLTYQDFIKAQDKTAFVGTLVNQHINSDEYQEAIVADLYDHQRNKTINEFVSVFFNLSGERKENYLASNHKIANNLFHRLNTQRCLYSLGNGVSFSEHKRTENINGTKVTIDETKERLGQAFDTDFKKLAYKSLIHGVTFGYWNSKKLYTFPITEFAPLWDEETGSLRAGVRFWKLDRSKPMSVVLYEEDGYTTYKSQSGKFEQVNEKHGYIINYKYTEADGEMIVGEDNYSSLPIIPMWGSQLKQSTLIGMREALDSVDLIRSGFANDLNDCAEIYWLLENYGGMNEKEIEKFRDRLKIMHIAEMDTSSGGRLTAYNQDLPYSARQTFLDSMKASIYEDFGALDVHTIAAGSTNDHIDAAYQPLDENADDFEYQCIEFIQQLLALENIEDTPIFKRNRISNQKEQTDMILSASDYLDDETILAKLPFITVDEITDILIKKQKDSEDRFEEEEAEEDEEIEEEDEEEEEEVDDIDEQLNALMKQIEGDESNGI